MSSGLKTAVTVARIGTIGTNKDGNCRNMDVATFTVAVQDIAAVWLTLLRTLVELYKKKRLRLLEMSLGCNL